LVLLLCDRVLATKKGARPDREKRLVFVGESVAGIRAAGAAVFRYSVIPD